MQVEVGGDEELTITIVVLDRRIPVVLRVKSKNELGQIELEALSGPADNGARLLTWSIHK